MSKACQDNKRYVAYREGIRHIYNENCFYYIDRIYDCVNVFTKSLKTNIAGVFQRSLEFSSDETFTFKTEYTSPDQLVDLQDICNGTLVNCFKSVKSFQPCEGYAMDKVLNCSIHDFISVPFKFFRCEQKYTVVVKENVVGVGMVPVHTHSQGLSFKNNIIFIFYFNLMFLNLF